jgi:hypothetical protein
MSSLAFATIPITPRMKAASRNRASKFGMEMSERTYQRGLRELLENEVLYRSPSADVFFVNIMSMFNGNRITLAKSYYVKDAGRQGELPLDDVAPLPALEKQG